MSFLGNLLGFIIPFVVDFINTKAGIENSKVKFGISLAISFVIAGVLHIGELQFGNVDEFFKTSGILFSESQALYKLYFEKSQLREKIQEAIE